MKDFLQELINTSQNKPMRNFVKTTSELGEALENMVMSYGIEATESFVMGWIRGKKRILKAEGKLNDN